MFRVPEDAGKPTFDRTFKVGFFRWLTSKKDERKEWTRRRAHAAWLAGVHQQAAKDARRAERKHR